MANESSKRTLAEVLAEVQQRQKTEEVNFALKGARSPGSTSGNTNACDDDTCSVSTTQSCANGPPDTVGNTSACGDWNCPTPPPPMAGDVSACTDWNCD